VLVGMTLALPGCGRDRPKTVPVRGRVTLAGGDLPAGGTLWFTPEEAAAGFALRPGTADFAADGAYLVKTFVPGDGLLPGRYRVRVDCWKVPPNMEGKPAQSHLPAKYQNPQTSGLVLEVRPDSAPITYDIDIPAAGAKR
jgi:hypothetical protein